MRAGARVVERRDRAPDRLWRRVNESNHESNHGRYDGYQRRIALADPAGRSWPSPRSRRSTP